MRKDLLPGEQVIVMTRPQPRALFLPAVVFILAPALAAFASAWIIRGGVRSLYPDLPADWTIWLVAGCMLAEGPAPAAPSYQNIPSVQGASS